MEETNTIFSQIISYFSQSGFEALEIIVIILFGFLIIKQVMKLIKQALLLSSLDRSLVSFAYTVINLGLDLLLVLYCLSRMQINITGVLAIVSAIGLSIGLALQDLVSGVANGLVIINTKPFKVDDFVTIGSYSGTIKEVSLLHTVLVTTDNRKIVLTNKMVYNSEIINVSAYPTRRLDINFGIDYGADIKKAISIIEEIVNKDSRISKDPAAFVRLTDTTDDALIITSRLWLKSGDYWDAKFDLLEKVLNEFKVQGIEVPYKQLTLSLREDTMNQLTKGGKQC